MDLWLSTHTLSVHCLLRMRVNFMSMCPGQSMSFSITWQPSIITIRTNTLGLNLCISDHKWEIFHKCRISVSEKMAVIRNNIGNKWAYIGTTIIVANFECQRILYNFNLIYSVKSRADLILILHRLSLHYFPAKEFHKLKKCWPLSWIKIPAF